MIMFNEFLTSTRLNGSGEKGLDAHTISRKILAAAYGKSGKMRRKGSTVLVDAGLSVRELMYVVERAREVLAGEATLLEIEGDVNIVGDLHGQFTDLLRIFDGIGSPPEQKYLFLGDYVDRGPNSIETITLLFAFKILYPDRVFLLRGNHETPEISRMYGFYDECKRRYSPKIWRTFTQCFRFLPIAALVGGRIFCAHGGLSPLLRDLDDLRGMRRPLDVADEGVVCDLLWSDPDPAIDGWDTSQRGVSFVYGEEIVEEFLERNELDLVCRAHEVVEDGYEFLFGRKLVTIFSATNYCGEFDNAGGVLRVSADLVCSLFILKPEDKTTAT